MDEHVFQIRGPIFENHPEAAQLQGIISKMRNLLHVVEVKGSIDEIGVFRLKGLLKPLISSCWLQGIQHDVQGGLQNGMKEGSISGGNGRSVGLES